MKQTYLLIITIIVILPLFCFTQTTIDKDYYQSLIPELKKSVEQNPYNITSWKALTEAYLSMEKPDSAAHIALSSEQYFPNDKILSAFYADLFWKASLYTEAAVWIEKLYSLNPSEHMHTLLINAYHNAGIKKAQASDWKQASQYFQNALELDPATKERYSPAALACTKVGDYERALEIINQGSERFGKYKQLLEIQKYIYFHRKDYKSLEQVLKNYIEKNPDDIDARLDLNRVRNVLGKPGEALVDLKKMKQQFPENMQIYGELSSLHKKFGEFAMQRQTYIDMLNQYQDADSLYLKIAHTYENEQNWTKARKYYNQYGEKYPESTNCMLLIANTFLKESKLDSALTIYRTVIKKEPKNVNTLEQAGKTAAEIHCYPEALDYFRSWSAESPEDPLPLIAQAKVLQKIGRRHEAMQKYEDAEKIKGNAFSAFQLFLINKELGNLDMAKHFQSIVLRRAIVEIAAKEKVLKSSVSTTPFFSQYGVNIEDYTKRTDEIAHLQDIFNNTVDNWIPDQSNDSPENQLKVLLEEYPGAPTILKILAEMYFEQDNFSQAEMFYKKFLSMNPRSIEGQRGLARVYEQTGNDKTAFLIYMRIVELDLTNQESYQGAIRFAEETGNLNQLARRWDQLHRANKNNKMLKDHLILVWNKLGRNDKVRDIID